ncbi:hypothetical protein [Defluviitalea raffinosedens]|uniref:Uncharacterized protein n=1 Tax=Defluviitalea raffinosedens TaxID=1450156 RepID=A0A7C8LED1_9FIRM|nr:hypothetical protein [Defluviitalea raffinosedens]KAE9636233.1 hypothetical protein GND95_03695 [Defluviitalea raffinosedens]MBM7685480.1 hypothetical protein [Defluviitalea raffinosedens]HHW66213.1 hypothetical protein [Candidatus Epulonipiscium sp.]
MNEAIIQNFTNKILSVDLKEIFINGNQFILNKGHSYSINNQAGDLAETNFFGKDLEFTIVSNDFEMPISIQLYENISGYYRIFVYNNRGMLTSINLSMGYSDGEISLEIQLKLFSRNMTKEERERNRDMLVMDLAREGIDIVKKNTVCFGKYDVINDKFIDTTEKKFLEQLIKVAIIKGHYMKNKGYELAIL